MNKQTALDALSNAKPDLMKHYGVLNLALFGSTVRGEAKPNSDLDIIVSFDGPATSKQYFGVKFYLEDKLGVDVDLVTDKAIKEALRPYVDREAIKV